MPIAVIAQNPNPTVPPSLAVGGLMIFTGVVECVFKRRRYGRDYARHAELHGGPSQPRHGD